MTYTDVLNNARQKLGDSCKACPICNGVACRNRIPGPGAKGVGDTAIRNYDKWAEIRLNMDVLCRGARWIPAASCFGRSFRYPFFAGPVGGGQPPLLGRLHRHDLQRRAGAGLRTGGHRGLYRRRRRPPTS